MKTAKRKSSADSDCHSVSQFSTTNDSTSDDCDSQYVTASESPDSSHAQCDDKDAIATNLTAIKIKYDSRRNQLTTLFNGKLFDIYFLDLYTDEYNRLEAMLSKAVHETTLYIGHAFIVLNDDQFCVQRLPMLLRSNISLYDKQWEINDISVIAFASTNDANNNNIMVKYKGRFYFAGQSLIDEYLDLLARTDYPMGTPIRLHTTRIVPNETEHILDVVSRGQFPAKQQVIIIDGMINTASKWRSFIEGIDLKRYVKMPIGTDLCTLANELIYWEDDGGSDEIYSETDFRVGGGNDGDDDGDRICNGNSTARKQENGQMNHSGPGDQINGGSKHDIVDKDGFKKVISKTERRQNKKLERNKYLVPGGFREMELMLLKTYPVDSYLIEIMKNKFVREGDTAADYSDEAVELLDRIYELKSLPRQIRLKPSNYNELFSLTLQMDDEYCRQQALHYNQKNVRIYSDNKEQYPELDNVYYIDLFMQGKDAFDLFDEIVSQHEIYSLNVSKMVPERHNNLVDYSEWLDNLDCSLEKTGVIIAVKHESLYFHSYEPLNLRYPNQLYYIHFFRNQIPYRMTRQALDFSRKYNLYDSLFPRGIFEENDPSSDSNEDIQYFERNLNDEQKLAISNIENKCSFPLPYMIFGPPGTGKTKTIVEAVAQIVTKTNEKILLCSMSNTTCDVLATRLLAIDVIAEKQCVYRLYSRMTSPASIPPQLKPISNFYDVDDNENSFYPALKFLANFQVIVCTLTTAGRLAQAKMAEDYPGHFSYIIIDECACATESFCIIPIAGICTTRGAQPITAQIVLSGDPKQLGPVVKCSMANKLGYGISLMERLMEREPYKKDPMKRTFNDKYIIQLKQNYRSHKDIIRFPSNKFYDGSIEAKAFQSRVCRFLGTEILPSPQFPIVLKSVQGVSERQFKHSLINYKEAEDIMLYVEQLLTGNVQPEFRGVSSEIIKKKLKPIPQGDIGVISTYRAQCKVLRNKFNKRDWFDIKVGTVDSFQGEERPVIIVSTVRARADNAGFLHNERRLNVLITRAMALLIIVGDPFTLEKSKHWRQFLMYLQENNAIIQSREPFMLETKALFD